MSVMVWKKVVVWPRGGQREMALKRGNGPFPPRCSGEKKVSLVREKTPVQRPNLRVT